MANEPVQREILGKRIKVWAGHTVDTFDLDVVGILPNGWIRCRGINGDGKDILINVDRVLIIKIVGAVPGLAVET